MDQRHARSRQLSIFVIAFGLVVACGCQKAGSGSLTSPVQALAMVTPHALQGDQSDESSTQGASNSSATGAKSQKAKSRDAKATRAKGAQQSEKAAEADKAEGALDTKYPFSHRVPVPELPQNLPWLNVSKPLKKADLKGKFVLLDFWTYCCINCMHILPELKKLEKQYPNELVVIGVHSAKFETEKGNENIAEAILRYEIEHPVVNDADHKIWNTYGVRSWPSIVMIDPTGHAVWGRSGEFRAEEIQRILDRALPYYRAKRILNEKPIKLDLLVNKQQATPLRFPGKVLADEAGQRLFIADSNHNRIVVAGLDGKLIATIGSGVEGLTDGDFATATFDHPQGMAVAGDTLYVADTENHCLRKADLSKQTVTTIAGLGEQAKNPWPGLDNLKPGDAIPARWMGKPKETALASPWDVLVHQKDLYIAMAGPHQIWKMPLDESEIGPYAGNGREDIVDGPLLPREPYEQGFASFAQPSGLSTDGTWLFVADSEGSSIRAVPFDPTKQVGTVVGTAQLPFNRLFHFGDQDGERSQVLLQHCLGVAYLDGKLYVADTYNDKIKVIDPATGRTESLAATIQVPGAPAELDEPGGISAAKGMLYVADTNNHRIRVIDLASGKIANLPIVGLSPPPEAQQ